jgi:hypothetical protein
MCLTLMGLSAAGMAASVPRLDVVWGSLCGAVTALFAVRAVRMAVVADAHGLSVRNLGRTYKVPWDEVTSLDAAASDNITRRAKSLVMRLADGRSIVCRGASSYSGEEVEAWRELLLSARPVPN